MLAAISEGGALCAAEPHLLLSVFLREKCQFWRWLDIWAGAHENVQAIEPEAVPA